MEMGGFITHTIFNEDMIYAGKIVLKGYLVAYQADARVFHSHNYGNVEQFKEILIWQSHRQTILKFLEP